MSQPLPPTPAEAARASLAQGAKDVASQALTRRLHTFARQKLPRPVYNLIFGGKSAAEVAEDEARRRIRNLLWGCGFSLTFGCLVGLVLLLVAAVVAWAVVMG
jgi:hypothetical protein